jgi:demethylmenaquinone methyltransferase / 2-methoxy-6-polyprenyl-1,4-benzoquinol methylase
VREMFSNIAPRYDFLNHALSLSIDRVWRRRVASRFRDVLQHPDSSALDVCCGTGDLAFALSRRSGGLVIGADFAHPMLVLANKKAHHRNPSSGNLNPVSFIEGDGLNLPFADASFDVVTLAFGFRNLASYDRGLREFARILRPGGQLGILEFSEPRGKVFGPLYRWYFAHILPRIGRMISSHNFAYSYLPDSVSRYLKPEELAQEMTAVGFRDVKFESWTGGAVTFHRGTI